MENKILKESKGRQFVGVVVSNKMKNTVIVAVDNLKKHPLYRKVIHRTHRFAAHTGNELFQLGDTVKIKEIKPISKTKHFEVIKKVEK